MAAAALPDKRLMYSPLRAALIPTGYGSAAS